MYNCGTIFRLKRSIRMLSFSMESFMSLIFPSRYCKNTPQKTMVYFLVSPGVTIKIKYIHTSACKLFADSATFTLKFIGYFSKSLCMIFSATPSATNS